MQQGERMSRQIMSRITGTGSFSGLRWCLAVWFLKCSVNTLSGGSSSRQLHFRVELSCCFRERDVFLDHTWKERNNEIMALQLITLLFKLFLRLNVTELKVLAQSFMLVLMNLYRINWSCKQKDMWEACFTRWIYVSSNEHKSVLRSDP